MVPDSSSAETVKANPRDRQNAMAAVMALQENPVRRLVFIKFPPLLIFLYFTIVLLNQRSFFGMAIFSLFPCDPAYFLYNFNISPRMFLYIIPYILLFTFLFSPY